jgi:aspartate kinase
VFTADPRRVPGARLLGRVDYAEMVELASSGAQVMHPRAVEIGAKFGVPIRVLSSFDEQDGGGTLITNRQERMEGLVITGLASQSGFARLILRGLPPTMEAVTQVVTELAGARVSVDMLVIADRPDRRRQLQLTVREDAAREALQICERIRERLGGDTVELETGLSRVAIVGSGMVDLPGVYARAFEALLTAGIDVHAVSTSSISITVLVDSEDEGATLQLLHAAFDLAAEPV